MPVFGYRNLKPFSIQWPLLSERRYLNTYETETYRLESKTQFTGMFISHERLLTCTCLLEKDGLRECSVHIDGIVYSKVEGTFSAHVTLGRT